MAISVLLDDLLLLLLRRFCVVLPQKLHFFITFRSVTTHEEDGGGGGDAIIILKHWRRGLVGQRERERERERERRPTHVAYYAGWRPNRIWTGKEAEIVESVGEGRGESDFPGTA